MSRILFYLNYAARNLRRSARWTVFAVFCIGAGVATVVALRSLGLAIGDSLIDNARQNLHGDVRVAFQDTGGFQAFNFGGNDEPDEAFSPEQVEAINEVAADYGGSVTAYRSLAGLQVTLVDAVTVGRPQFVSAYLIDPETFPPNEPIRAQDPAGVLLNDLFTGEANEIVISRNLADQQNIRVGDTVRVSGTTETFIVRGIVATEIESGVTNIFASFFGFAYLDVAEAETLQAGSAPNIVSFTINEDLNTEDAFGDLRQNGIYQDVQTVDDLIATYTVIADYLGRFIVIMGLGALLIGGVGIINTMLVLVGRRTSEIAALKTFGLKGGQIFWLFMSEAFLLGVLGSVVGCIFGVLLSILVNSYGEAFLQQGLTWRLYPEALLYGFGLGMVVTLVFGVLPILTANKVRPATILRPNETVIPRTGVFHSLIALALVVVVIGGVAGRIIGDIPIGNGRTISGVAVGMGGVGITLLVMGLLVLIFWVIVWAVSRLPSWGIVDLRLALRNMTSRRVRTATTLLALAAGMFALSAITFVGVGVQEIINISLSQNLGGNVIVVPLLGAISPGIAQGLLENQLDSIDGILYRTTTESLSAQVVTIDGIAPEVELPFDLPDGPPGSRRNSFSTNLFISVRDTDNPTFESGIVAGRALTPADEGQAVMVIDQSIADQYSNVSPGVGSIIRLDVRGSGDQIDFEVVGVSEGGGSGFGFPQNAVIPPGSLEAGGFPFVTLQTEPDKLNEVLLALSENPLLFTLDITFIDSFLTRFIQQFSAIPTLVGLLSLLAAAVTMANTVSLATLERRRQIGILKAVGLKGRRVLVIMLIENTIIGLLGGVLGIGVSALIVALITALGAGESIPIPRDAAPLAIALILASVAIAFISTFLSAGVAVRERVTNVLRYE